MNSFTPNFWKYSYSCRWTIEKFSSQSEDPIESPKFHPFPKQASCLLLNKIGTIISSPDNIALTLCIGCTGAEVLRDVSVIKVTTVISTNTKQSSETEEVLYKDYATFKYGGFYHERDLLSHLSINKFKKFQLIEDNITFTITLKIALVDPGPNNDVIDFDNQIMEETEKQTDGLNQLVLDLKNILDLGLKTDVTLKVDNENIRAHKTILRARSPVFNRMFDHNTSECNSNIIDVSDVDIATMRKFISYLYTGDHENCNFDDLCLLYYVADKYEVLALRDSCKRELLHLMKPDNACPLMSLANRHGDKPFEDKVAKFIRINFKSIVQTKSWDDFVANDTQLAALLISRCAKDL